MRGIRCLRPASLDHAPSFLLSPSIGQLDGVFATLPGTARLLRISVRIGHPLASKSLNRPSGPDHEAEQEGPNSIVIPSLSYFRRAEAFMRLWPGFLPNPRLFKTVLAKLQAKSSLSQPTLEACSRARK